MSMKKFLVGSLILLLCAAGRLSGQHPAADALALSGRSLILDGKVTFNLGDSVVISNILRKYEDTVTTYSSLWFRFASNPFLSLPRIASMSSGGGFTLSPAKDGTEMFAGPGGALGGIDVTTIADGLARFLVTRTKEELNVAFFTRFRETLESPRFTDICVLFPNTHMLLTAIGSEIYDYNRYIQNLREAFLADLVTLDAHLPGLIGNNPDFFRTHFGLAAGLNAACYLSRSLRDRQHPGDILADYPLEYLIKPGETEYFDRNWSGAIQTLQLLSASLQNPSPESGQYWIGPDQVLLLLRNRNAFQLYLGLVYQMAKSDRYENIPFEKGSLTELLEKIDVGSDYPAWRDFVTGFARKTDALSTMLRNAPDPKNDSASFEFYARYFRASADLVEYGTRAAELPHFSEVTGVTLPDRLDICFRLAGETGDLTTSILRKNYAASVNHLVNIYRLARTGPETDAAGNSTEVLAKLAKYGAFISSVATAKTSGEVSQAIEAAALPSGSSRIKRESAWNVSLNAYAGLFLGYEHISGYEEGGFSVNTYGVAAPVGVAVSTGGHSFLFLWPENEGHWSYSLFASLIDVGALAAFRFEHSETVDQVPTIHLRDIVAPGLFLSVGFPRCPLSLNLGLQVGPNLREVNVLQPDGSRINKYGNNTSWRYSASLVVDIPLFNLYTKTRR